MRMMMILFFICLVLISKFSNDIILFQIFTKCSYIYFNINRNTF